MNKNKDNNKEKKHRSWRAPYADLGMTVAVASLIVMLVKSIVFGFTIAAIAWMVFAVLYVAVSLRYSSRSRMVKACTTVFLVGSLLSGAASIWFDRPARPKMVPFQGVELTDTVVPDEVFIIETPPPVVVDTLDDDSTPPIEPDTLALPTSEPPVSPASDSTMV